RQVGHYSRAGKPSPETINKVYWQFVAREDHGHKIAGAAKSIAAAALSVQERPGSKISGQSEVLGAVAAVDGGRQIRHMPEKREKRNTQPPIVLPAVSRINQIAAK